MISLDKLGNQQVKFLVSVGEYLAENGNVGRTAVFNKLGLTRKDVTRATTLCRHKSTVADCVSVVSALQVCQHEQDRLREEMVAKRTKAPKGLSADELSAKAINDSKENEDYNAHRAMREL